MKKIVLSHLIDLVLYVYFQDLYENLIMFWFILMQKIIKGSQTFKQHCVCIYIYIYIYTHTHTHTHIYIYTNIYIYICKCVYIWKTCTKLCMYACVYIINIKWINLKMHKIFFFLLEEKLHQKKLNVLLTLRETLIKLWQSLCLNNKK